MILVRVYFGIPRTTSKHKNIRKECHKDVAHKSVVTRHRVEIKSTVTTVIELLVPQEVSTHHNSSENSKLTSWKQVPLQNLLGPTNSAIRDNFFIS